ncbi:uncharacterized protein GLRG_08209 [Colletotrichum graminicola M1.001]|uniref:Uncharacterized protein n=1 Tax=Colletotrichum graminicola (strain M1.001 / M2 / FGSC 10212) TaxID=645133 RepID=E3QQC7_COLGM|nr:uncharacterized protein GLRG_08209 [Colletotrichum graminicola M1.001]EFQ33065.1 hypothetical protein GLRG_08209 [Colletotrichum graminicola M1.001]
MVSKIAIILAAVAPAVLAAPTDGLSARHADIATLYGIDTTNKTVIDLRSDTDKLKRQNPGHIWACDNVGFVEPCSLYVVQNGQWYNLEGLGLNNRISSIGADWGAGCWAWDHFDANGCWNENGAPALDITYPGLRDLTSFSWNDKIGCVKCDFWGS